MFHFLKCIYIFKPLVMLHQKGKITLFFSCLSGNFAAAPKKPTFLSFENKIHAYCNNYGEYN